MRYRVGLAIAVAVVLTFAGGGTASAVGSSLQAQSGSTGTITGKVTNSSGTALIGVCVSAFQEGGRSYGFGHTDSSGLYSVSGLADGIYSVTFTGCKAGNYPAKKVRVGVIPGQITIVNATLVFTGGITGKVINHAGGGLAGVCVSATPQGVGEPKTTYSSASGVYGLGALAGGTYSVLFTHCGAGSYVSQRIGNVAVREGQVTTLNVTLAPGGTIAGKVTDHAGAALGGVCAAAIHSSGTSGGSAHTDASGGYKIEGLVKGVYTVHFSACSAGNYVPREISGVSVTVHGTTTEDAVLADGGRITGRVTDASGRSLVRACVTALSSDGRFGGAADTDASGAYTIIGLGTATYSIELTACRAGSYQSKTITGVSVTAGRATTENAILGPA